MSKAFQIKDFPDYYATSGNINKGVSYGIYGKKLCVVF